MKAERKVMVKLMEKREELVEKEVRNSATKDEEERTVRRVHATSREQLEFFQLVLQGAAQMFDLFIPPLHILTCFLIPCSKRNSSNQEET